MGIRDAGWIQIYAENNQEAYDNFLQAMPIGESPEVRLPVMICQDGFITSHALENIVLLDTDSVKQFEEDYKAAYNVDEIPNMFAPLAYDAAMLLCEGLKAAEEQGLIAGTDEYKQAVIDAIKNMNGTEGITGSYSFDEYNNPIKPVAIIELTGGDEVYQEMY